MSEASVARGEEMLALIERLYPICRSITGQGVRDTLTIIAEHVDLRVTEVPTGEQVFDWQVPREWVIRDAWVKDDDGRKVIDFAAHNLHVVSYSDGVHRTMSREELEPHLHSLPDHPDWIPYRTSYYNRGWGFCLSQRQRDALSGERFEVCIDAELIDGSLTYGEVVIPGETDEEIVFYSHVCHPSLANDNLAGLAVCTFLMQARAGQRRRFTYRFVFGPGTIGSITWLARNEERLGDIRMGLVAVLLGDRGPLRYKQSPSGDAHIDRIVPRALADRGHEAIVEPFSPYGYEERQFGSPGIRIPTGRLSRSANGGYPEYHSSADNLDLVSGESLAESLAVLERVVDIIERDACYLNLAGKGEPQLGRRGLYGDSGGKRVGNWEMAMLWVLNQSDGSHTLLDIAEKSGLTFAEVAAAADNLLAAGLLERLHDSNRKQQ